MNEDEATAQIQQQINLTWLLSASSRVEHELFCIVCGRWRLHHTTHNCEV